MQQSRAMGTQTVYMKPTRTGIHFELRDQGTREQLLAKLSEFFEKERKRQHEVKEKAKKRREGDGGDPSQEGDTEMNAQTGRVTLQKAPRHFVNATIEGVSIPLVVDTYGS